MYRVCGSTGFESSSAAGTAEDVRFRRLAVDQLNRMISKAVATRGVAGGEGQGGSVEVLVIYHGRCR